MSKNKIIPFPSEKPDIQETMRSARGVVLTCLSSWELDQNENAHGCLRRYCEYIACPVRPRSKRPDPICDGATVWRVML